MKKWFRFFGLSFFSDKISKEATKHGYTNVLIGLILSFIFLWGGFVGGEMLPFSAHYNNSPDFQATVHSVFSNPDINKRIEVEIQDGVLMAKKHGMEYAQKLLINTFENEADREYYSVNGYNLVIDSRPAETLAVVEAYCLSNDGNNTEISYEDYLTLSAVARLNFDFKLRYTAEALELTDELVEGYKSYLNSTSDDNRSAIEKMATDLAENKITKDEYNKSIYELYFTNYYPSITDYESTSKVPLLRNYYYHQYIKAEKSKYLFIFDDYLAGSFETEDGIVYSFYGFYSNLESGTLVPDGATQAEADKAADSFIKDSYGSIAPLTLYAYALNVFSFIPFIALMPMVVALLAYSILKLRGIESINSLGSMLKIIGSYIWASAAISAMLNVIFSFFVQRNILSVLPLLLFFMTLAIRSLVFAVRESMSYLKQEQTIHTEA